MPEQTDNELAIMEGRIPSFDNEDKVKYLSYRAVGFTVTESCHLAEVEYPVVRAWRKEDEHFATFENTNLRELQKSASKDILENEFRRNLMMLFRKDARIIQKSMQATWDSGRKQSIDGIETLTDREWDWIKTIRKYYTPDQLLQLSKILDPEEYNDKRLVVLTWDGRPAALPQTNDIEGYSIEVLDE